MPFEPLTAVIAVLAVVILGLSKGGFAGVGMLSTPLLSLVLPPATAVTVLLPILLVQDAVSLWAYRTHVDVQTLKALLPAAIVGVVAGAAIVGHIDANGWAMVLGFVSVLFGLERLWRLWRQTAQQAQPNRTIGAICGALAGMTSMIAHAGVPPFQFYVLPQKLSRDVYVGTSVAFFAVVNWTKLPFFASLGQISKQSLIASLLLMPVALLSVFIGIRLVRKISQQGFQMTANALLIAIGVALILRGLLM